MSSLAAQVSDELRKRKWKITSAESCTGGMICAAITDLPGSSEIFDRGFITYSNQAKIDLLGVYRSIREAMVCRRRISNTPVREFSSQESRRAILAHEHDRHWIEASHGRHHSGPYREPQNENQPPEEDAAQSGSSPSASENNCDRNPSRSKFWGVPYSFHQA